MESIENGIDLRKLINIILNRLWIIILVTAVTTSAGLIISFRVLDTIYESSTTLIVNNNKTNDERMLQYYDVLLNQKLVKTYEQIVKSYTVSNQVIKNLSLDCSISEFQSWINVSSVQDTEIIKIRVSHQDPILATKIANEVATVFKSEVIRIMDVDNVQVIDTAIPPKTPVKPDHKINAAVAFVLGIMLGLGIVFLVEYLDDTIKTEDDVKKYLDLPVIGLIPNIEDVSN